MPQFTAFEMVKWLHIVSFSTAGGAAVVVLLLSGFEDTREDLRGLAATVWAKVVRWGFRFALLLGVVLLVMKLRMGIHAFDYKFLHYKIALSVVLVALSEMAPKGLAIAKRGAAMLCLVLFLLITFLATNGNALGMTRSAQARTAVATH